MLLTQKTNTDLLDYLKNRFSGAEDSAQFDDVMSIQNEIQEDISNLLIRFFQHKSDANKYLTASHQEDLENDFKTWVTNLI